MNIIFDGHNSLHRYDSVMPPEIKDVAAAIFKKYWKMIKLERNNPILLIDPISPDKEYSARLLRSRETLKILFTYLGFNVIEGKDKEVGKIIGCKPDEEFLIESNDKDFCQLVSPKVSLLRYENSEYFIHGRDYVINRWGVNPEQFADYLCLAGDATDGIKGVPKVGPKTAVKFLNTHGSIDNFVKKAPFLDRDPNFLLKDKVCRAVYLEWHDGSIAKKREEVVIPIETGLELSLAPVVADYPKAIRLLQEIDLSNIAAHYFCNQ